jgi:beta-hydroxylase
MNIILCGIVIIIIFFIIITVLFIRFYYNRRTLFYTTNEYPQMKIVEDNYKVFKEEIPPFRYNNIVRTKDQWNNKDGTDLFNKLKHNTDWIKGWASNVEWYQFPLMYHNKVVGYADKICPKSISILRKLPFIRIAGYALLRSNNRLPIHTDNTGFSTESLACNMLLTNTDSSLYIEDIDTFREYELKIGQMVIFNSELNHYAINKSNTDRIILYIDFKTNSNYGKRLYGYGLGKQLGYPTINMKLVKPLNCNIYKADTEYGKVIIIVDCSKLYCEMHYINKKTGYDKQLEYYIWNIEPITKPIKNIKSEEGILGIINRGCKQCN